MDEAKKPLVDVSAEHVMMVVPFKDVMNMRQYFNGVYVVPHHKCGVVVIGCDGNAGALAHDPTGFVDQPRILNLNHHTIRAMRYTAASKRVQVKDNHIFVVSGITGTEFFIQPGAPFIEAQYPDVKKLVKDPAQWCKTKEHGAIQTRYLARFQAACGNRAKWGDAMQLFGRGDQTSVVIGMLSSRSDFIALLMPVTASERERSVLALWSDMTNFNGQTPAAEGS